MVIRRNDQRRRRVVIDEVSQHNDGQSTASRESSSSSKKNKSDADARNYSFGANRRNQFKTTDFIPKRFLSFGLVVLALLSAIGGLNLLSTHADQWKDVIGNEGVRAFSIVGVGSLSSWFSSFLLIISGLASLQIYALRQHRCDDYRGTYRLWLWMSLLFIMASIHCIVDLGSVLASITEAITRQPVGNKIWALVTFKIVALTLLVVRGVFEVRESRGSFALVIIVWVAFASATLLQIPAIKNSIVVDYETCYGNILLFGTTMLLLSQFVYARFVYLHAHGLITSKPASSGIAKQVFAKFKVRTASSEVVKAQPAKKKKKKVAPSKVNKVPVNEVPVNATATISPSPSKPKTRPPVPKPSKKVIPPVPKPSHSPAGKNVSHSPEEVAALLNITPEQYGKMSKSERRRQRKLAKRARRAA